MLVVGRRTLGERKESYKIPPSRRQHSRAATPILATSDSMDTRCVVARNSPTPSRPGSLHTPHSQHAAATGGSPHGRVTRLSAPQLPHRALRLPVLPHRELLMEPRGAADPGGGVGARHGRDIRPEGPPLLRVQAIQVEKRRAKLERNNAG
eukprot:scaffold3431_cov128-Isochrysis_galbana.AAC.4